MNLTFRHKLVAAFFTMVILILMFFWLNSMAVPRHDLIAERYDDINWTRFVPQTHHVKTEKVQSPEQPTRVENANEPEIQRIELEDVLAELENDVDLLNEAPVNQSPQPTSKNRTNTRAKTITALDVESLGGELNTLMGEEASLKVPSSKRSSRRPGKGAGITVKSSTDVSNSGNEYGEALSSGIDGPGGDDRKADKGGNITLKDLEEFQKEFGNFSPLYRPLVEWMKKHPANLPGVVKKFMDYTPGTLTSMIRFSVEGITYDMFLLCVESTYEVRVALVQGERVIYLIDQGFQKKSNFLRTGSVTRLSDGAILEFSTNLQPAGSNQTKQFYQIFLSWWETVKHEVE
ncbi:MAG: hypothetical protein D6748_00060 [Calditrichaeota bacterium]|nr:MAG: hypothetical protein D6748_00060 [Calditrichota bacterium]